MIRTFQQSDSSGKKSLTQVANLSAWTVVYIQVQGPQTLILATDEQTLEVGGGLQMLASDGIQKLTWKGELWATGSGPTAVADFEFVGQT